MELVSRKQFKRAVMPEVGTVIDDKYRIKYVHYGNFRFTAEVKGELPEIGKLIEWQGKDYLVTLHLPENKISATFYGFQKNPEMLSAEEAAPVEENVSTESGIVTCMPSTEEELSSCVMSDKPCDCDG